MSLSDEHALRDELYNYLQSHGHIVHAKSFIKQRLIGELSKRTLFHLSKQPNDNGIDVDDEKQDNNRLTEDDRLVFSMVIDALKRRELPYAAMILLSELSMSERELLGHDDISAALAPGIVSEGSSASFLQQMVRHSSVVYRRNHQNEESTQTMNSFAWIQNRLAEIDNECGGEKRDDGLQSRHEIESRILSRCAKIESDIQQQFEDKLDDYKRNHATQLRSELEAEFASKVDTYRTKLTHEWNAKFKQLREKEEQLMLMYRQQTEKFDDECQIRRRKMINESDELNRIRDDLTTREKLLDQKMHDVDQQRTKDESRLARLKKEIVVQEKKLEELQELELLRSSPAKEATQIQVTELKKREEDVANKEKDFNERMTWLQDQLNDLQRLKLKQHEQLHADPAARQSQQVPPSSARDNPASTRMAADDGQVMALQRFVADQTATMQQMHAQIHSLQQEMAAYKQIYNRPSREITFNEPVSTSHSRHTHKSKQRHTWREELLNSSSKTTTTDDDSIGPILKGIKSKLYGKHDGDGVSTQGERPTEFGLEAKKRLDFLASEADQLENAYQQLRSKYQTATTTTPANSEFLTGMAKQLVQSTEKQMHHPERISSENMPGIMSKLLDETERLMSQHTSLSRRRAPSPTQQRSKVDDMKSSAGKKAVAPRTSGIDAAIAPPQAPLRTSGGFHAQQGINQSMVSSIFDSTLSQGPLVTPPRRESPKPRRSSSGASSRKDIAAANVTDMNVTSGTSNRSNVDAELESGSIVAGSGDSPEVLASKRTPPSYSFEQKDVQASDSGARRKLPVDDEPVRTTVLSLGGDRDELPDMSMEEPSANIEVVPGEDAEEGDDFESFF